MVFLLTFLLAVFFRGARFVVLAGLLSASAALPADDAFALVPSVLAGFADSAFSAGLEAGGFESDLLGSAFFDSTGLISVGFVSEVLVSEGFVSTFAESAGIGFLSADLAGAASGFDGLVEA